jgi:hypothetical protein
MERAGFQRCRNAQGKSELTPEHIGDDSNFFIAASFSLSVSLRRNALGSGWRAVISSLPVLNAYPSGVYLIRPIRSEASRLSERDLPPVPDRPFQRMRLASIEKRRQMRLGSGPLLGNGSERPNGGMFYVHDTAGDLDFAVAWGAANLAL